MDKSRVSLWVTTIVALMAGIAGHGMAVLDVLAKAPAKLEAWSSGLALGIVTFFVSLVISTLFWLKERSVVEQCGKRLRLSPDGLAFLSSVAFCLFAQLFGNRSGNALFWAIAFGIVSGLLAPWAGRLLRRIFARKADKPLPPPQAQP